MQLHPAAGTEDGDRGWEMTLATHKEAALPCLKRRAGLRRRSVLVLLQRAGVPCEIKQGDGVLMPLCSARVCVGRLESADEKSWRDSGAAVSPKYSGY